MSRPGRACAVRSVRDALLQVVGARLVAVLSSFGAAVVFAPVASANFNGGGQPKSDCYIVYPDLVINKGSNKVECTDGDPTCDTDGQCQGTCSFGITACINDPNVAGCTPSNVTAITVNGAALNLPGVPSSENVCGDQAIVAVPVKQGKKLKKGKGFDLVDLGGADEDDALGGLHQHARAAIDGVEVRLELREPAIGAGGKPLAGAGDGFLEPRGLEGLQQVIDGADLEGAHGVGVVGGGEDDGRRGIGGQFFQHVEAIEARHLDVEKEQAGPQLRAHRQCRLAIGGLAGDLDVGLAG